MEMKKEEKALFIAIAVLDQLYWIVGSIVGSCYW